MIDTDSSVNNPSQKERRLILVNGIVQGVGFRPFVYRLAKDHKLSGFVKNTSDGVEIEIEGFKDQLNLFQKELVQSPPPLSEIRSVNCKQVLVKDSTDFLIHSSVISQQSS